MFRARKSKGLRRKPPVAARPGTPGGSARPCLPVRPAARACFRSRAFRPHPPDKTLYGLLPRPCASCRMRSESRTFRARKSKGLRRKPPVAARPGTPGGSARPCLPVRPAARACFRSRAFRPHPPDKTLYGLLPRPCASCRMRSESRTFRARKSKGLRRKPPVAARPGTPVRWKKKGRAADARSSAAHRLSKPPGKYERGEALANKKSTRRRVRRVREGFAAENPIFQRKILSLPFSRPEI